MIEIGDTLSADALGIVVTSDAGALADAATAVLTITLPSGATATPAITHPSTGIYYPTGYVTTFAGRYDYRWVLTTITGGAVSEVSEGSFVVATSAAPPVLSWTTLDHVAAMTGITPTADQLVQATGVISLACGRDPGTIPAGAISARDLYWLKMAACYQAAWLTAQYDAFTRSGVSTINQDGQQVTFTPTGQTLAPLAAKALRRLSWKGTTSVHVQGVAEQAAVALPVGSALRDYDDDGAYAEQWIPM